MDEYARLTSTRLYNSFSAVHACSITVLSALHVCSHQSSVHFSPTQLHQHSSIETKGNTGMLWAGSNLFTFPGKCVEIII